MTLPRSKYVQDEKEGVYHCFTRCVRRAFLCGFDMLSSRDFSHRKDWLVERLKFQASIFAIEVIAYSVMANHYHTIVRTRPDKVERWSDREVATRWLMLFSKEDCGGAWVKPPAESKIQALVNAPERIAKLRRRLSSLSWFIGRLNEFIARAANREDDVKGRFWESRYKCQALLDEPAVAACMIYVDLNPVRAGLAQCPEESNFTSIQERIRLWQKALYQSQADFESIPADRAWESLAVGLETIGSGVQSSQPKAQSDSCEDPPNTRSSSEIWLCPIQACSAGKGVLQMSETQYFDLVDKSGRMIHPGKSGAIDSDLEPILLRIKANPGLWAETILHFGSRFYLAAGLLSSLREFASNLGQKWLKGLTAARAAFV